MNWCRKYRIKHEFEANTALAMLSVVLSNAWSPNKVEKVTFFATPLRIGSELHEKYNRLKIQNIFGSKCKFINNFYKTQG